MLIREENGLFLDNKAEFFQNLNGATNEISIKFSSTEDGVNRLKNDKYQTYPGIMIMIEHIKSIIYETRSSLFEINLKKAF